MHFADKTTNHLLFRPGGGINPEIVGKSARTLAEKAGISVPGTTQILVAREQEAGPTRPYSMEKLCPVLAFFVMDSEDAVLEKAVEVLTHEGSGHTFSIHATDEAVIRKFAARVPVSRFLDTAAAGKFTYDPATKALAFSGIADGTEIVVYYKRKITADVLDNDSETYSGKCALYIDALGEDKCANVYRIQFYIPKADFNGEFSLEMGENQTVHSFDAEALAGACGAGGKLWTYTIFGANTEDVA